MKKCNKGENFPQEKCPVKVRRRGSWRGQEQFPGLKPGMLYVVEWKRFKIVVGKYWDKDIFKGMKVINIDLCDGENGSLIECKKKIPDKLAEQVFGWNCAMGENWAL